MHQQAHPSDSRSAGHARPETTPDAFARFLEWLTPAAPTVSADEYCRVRRRLARFFAARGCWEADTLADRVIERVAAQIDRLVGRYSGNPARYLYAVARNVYREHFRARKTAERHQAEVGSALHPSADEESAALAERAHRCLEPCLAALTDSERRLVEAYYQADPAGRAGRRQQLAEEAGLTADALRQRTHRLRERLKACLRGCMQEDR